MNPSRTILIIDDEHQPLRLRVSVLEHAGDSTWAAATGLGDV
jgi:CheY-like chemotaxis protein